MKTIAIPLALVASAMCMGARAATPATTLEVSVMGLNCSLCSTEMKTKLKAIAGARDIEPRLECGKIYFEMPKGAALNERILSATLRANGFTFEGAKPSNKTLIDVRKTAEDAC